MVCKIKTLEKPVVYIVDGDHKLLDSLSNLLHLNDVKVEVFESAENFLKKKVRSRAACLIVEVNLPNMDGIQLLEHINNLGIRLPTIVLSSGSDVSEAVRAMQAQAIDFIEKPFIENTLIEKVLHVIEQA
ncbi:MAG: two-component system response regulator FixJ [Paraglaciecola sp.]|jgi:two-component system response regulator FixJ